MTSILFFLATLCVALMLTGAWRRLIPDTRGNIEISGVPAAIGNLIQQNFLQKAFQQSLRPKLMYRREALREQLTGRTMGETITQTRRGLMVPTVTPTTPGQDPTLGSYSVEQWTAVMNRFTGGYDTRLPSSAIQIVNQFLEDATALAEQAGWSLDRLVRNALYRAYVGGDTLVTAASTTSTSLQVAAINGFRFAPSGGKMLPVSSTNPLTITVNAVANTVVDTTPLDRAFPDGPGTLILGTSISATARWRVVSAVGPAIIRPAGAATIDAMTSSSPASFAMLTAARRTLVANRVPMYADGTYHCHADPQLMEQLLSDSTFKQLYQTRYDSTEYRDGYVIKQVGLTFFENTDNPSPTNLSGSSASNQTNLHGSAVQAKELGCEVINDSGVVIRRSIVMGARAICEFYIPESDYLAEAAGRIGPYGYQGRFLEGTGGFEADMDGIRYVLRPPQDRLLDLVSQAWSFTGDWVPPTDLNAPSSPSVYKRACVMEFAGV